MSLPLIAVDQVLTSVAGTPNEEDLQAYVLSMVFTNAAARTARNQSADAEDKAQAFAAQWNSQLGNLGWVITASGTGILRSVSSGETTTVAQQLRTQTGSSAVAATLDALEPLLGDPSPAVQALLGMFWEAGCAQAPFTATIGQLSAGSDGPVLDLATFTLPLDALATKARGVVFGHSAKLNPTDVHGLFAQVLASSVELTVSHITARLQPEVFATRRADLVAKLQGRAASHYCSVPAALVEGLE